MSEQLLSIIVPVYNVEEYLPHCINSLLDQGLTEKQYEIILVNDGSTDNSPVICQSYVDKYPFIHCYSQKNQGLSGARNTGMKHVAGKYIQFVDSDDFLQPNSIKAVLEAAEKYDADLAFFQGRYYPQTEKITCIHPFEHDKVYNGDDLLLSSMIVGSVWCNIYKTTFLKESKITFYPGIFHEDIDFNHRLYPKARRVIFTDADVYRYRYNNGSITHVKNPKKAEKRILDNILISHNIKNLVSEDYISPAVKKVYMRKSNSILMGELLTLVRDKSSFELNFAVRCVDYAKGLGVYPIKGKTLSWKTTFLKCFINSRFLYLSAVRLFAR